MKTTTPIGYARLGLSGERQIAVRKNTSHVRKDKLLSLTVVKLVRFGFILYQSPVVTMSATISSSAPASTPLSKRRTWKWLCAGLGCLLIGGIIYSQPLGRESGIHVLGRFGPRVVPWLLSFLEDSDRHVQKVAYEKIGSMGLAAVPSLLDELNNLRPVTRANAARMLSLSDIHSGQEIQICSALQKLLDDNNRIVRLAAIQAQTSLGTSASPALPKLKSMLDEDDAEIRLRALQAVTAIDRDSNETLSVVLRMLQDTEPMVRKDACTLLETIGTKDPRAVTALIEALRDPVPEVRGSAADYLGEIGPAGKVAIQALEVVAENDPNLDIRTQAAQSAKYLKDLPMP